MGLLLAAKLNPITAQGTIDEVEVSREFEQELFSVMESKKSQNFKEVTQREGEDEAGG